MFRVLILTGTCGSGKSTVSRLLAEAGWLRVSEDDFWNDMFGRQRGAFGSEEHRQKRQRVHRAVFDAVAAALRRRQRVVIDATVHESPPEAYLEYRDWFEERAIPWSLRALHPALQVAIDRDARRDGWHAGRDRVSSLHVKFTGDVFGPECFVDTSRDTPRETLRRLLDLEAPHPVPVPRAPEAMTTARLLLRRPEPGDRDAIFRRYAGDRDCLRYIGWKAHESTRDTQSFLELSDGAWRSWPAGPYLIFPASGGPLLGSTGLAFESPERASTGYVLARDAWGRGYATEASFAMVVLARRLNVRRLTAVCHVAHGPSRRVLEKAGFTRERTLRDQAFPNLEAGAPREAFLYVLETPSPEAVRAGAHVHALRAARGKA